MSIYRLARPLVRDGALLVGAGLALRALEQAISARECRSHAKKGLTVRNGDARVFIRQHSLHTAMMRTSNRRERDREPR